MFRILFFLVLNQYSKQLMIFVESKKKFLIRRFSSDLYHIYTIDFNCFEVRNGQCILYAMRPKRCLVDLDVVWRSWRSSFGKCAMQRNALNSKMIFRSLNPLLENVQCKRMHWTKNVNVLQVRSLFRKCGNEINALNLN